MRKYPPVENGFFVHSNQADRIQKTGTNTGVFPEMKDTNCEPVNLLNFDDDDDDVASGNVPVSSEGNKAIASIDDLFTCQQEFGAEVLKPDVLSWSPTDGIEWEPKMENEDSRSNSGMMSPKAGSSVSSHICFKVF